MVAPDRLNPGSFVPLYVQLTEILQERIEEGRWAAGERFASEAQLCEEFGVSRTVVRPALTILENNGLLVRIKGKGTFVAPAKAVHMVGGLTRDLIALIGDELKVRITLFELAEPDAELTKALDLPTRAGKIAHAGSLITIDDRPVAFRDSFIPLSRVDRIEKVLSPGLELDASSPVLLPDLRLEGSDITIETSYCSPFEASLFGANAGSPSLLVRCIEYIAGRRRVELARMVYRADVVTLITHRT